MKDLCQYGNRPEDEWEILPWIPDPRPPFKIWVKPEQIAPFFLIPHHPYAISLLLKISDEFRTEEFRRLGLIGSSEDWERLVRGVIQEFEENNSGVDLFHFDSDEDVFCVYSQYIDDLMLLSKMIRAACDNEKTMGMYLNIDMYPLYWTPSRGGIIMRYTYEYKRKCVELYREGKWPETPEGVSDKSFRDKVRLWVRAEDSRGPEALKHKNFNRNWTPEERLELVSQVMSGKSCVSVAIEAGIQDRLLYQWVQNYKTKGYNGLVEMKKGRPSKGVPQMKKEEARPLNESEREELIRLRAENEYIKAENEVIKKEIALREERHAAQLKARKQRSSKSCVKKDTN